MTNHSFLRVLRGVRQYSIVCTLALVLSCSSKAEANKSERAEASAEPHAVSSVVQSVRSASSNHSSSTSTSRTTSMTEQSTPTRAVATFGAGCFWCVEAVFQRADGVESVVSGYMGGHITNPTYKQVCTGETGHAEVCQITYNPQKISFTDLLEILFGTHDPTTLNRQGNDEGTQYRSAIFYHTPEQKDIAEKLISALDKSKIFPSKIVTEVVPAAIFYKAEDYHQNYYNENGTQPYCAFVVRPKVDKFIKNFSAKLKAGAGK